jgi:hypothetical protein
MAKPWRGEFVAITLRILDEFSVLFALAGQAHDQVAWSRCGHRAALLYSFVMTTKFNDVDPQAWLADVLGRIAGHSADELLPWNHTTLSAGRRS